MSSPFDNSNCSFYQNIVGDISNENCEVFADENDYGLDDNTQRYPPKKWSSLNEVPTFVNLSPLSAPYYNEHASQSPRSFYTDFSVDALLQPGELSPNVQRLSSPQYSHISRLFFNFVIF